MRNEVTVSACQHSPSVALAIQSFPYLLTGSVTARSLAACVWTKSMAWLCSRRAMPRFLSTHNSLAKARLAWLEGSICAVRRKFYVVNDQLGKEARPWKKMGFVKAAAWALSKVKKP